MKHLKKVFIISFFLVSTTSFSQDIEQTKNWLDNQLTEYYSHDRYGFNLSNNTFIHCEHRMFLFSEKFLIIEVTNCKDISHQTTKYYLLEYKNIKSIRVNKGSLIHNNPLYSNEGDYLIGESLEINCDNICSPKDLVEAGKIERGEIVRPEGYRYTIFVNTSNTDILENNMRNRILKAFNHLVELCGGKTANDNLF